MSKRRFLVTSALPYSNGLLHVGHIAGCYLPADIYVRYLKSKGEEVLFVCGSDEYGVPTLLSARKEGVDPSEIVKKYHDMQDADFKGLGINFDIYGGTSVSKYHRIISQEIFLNIYKNGYFEKREVEQLYDPEAGMFLADRYVKGTCYHEVNGEPCNYPEAYGDQCEKCGRTIDATKLINPVSVISGARPEIRKTVHWFLKLPELAERLRQWIGSHPEWRPIVKNFTAGLLKTGLLPRAMTRDLDWGIPVPLDDPDARGKVLYVWFDAPIGYVSFTAEYCQQTGTGWEDYKRWWKDPECKIVHFIGEDNVVFHAITWPAVLMAEGSFSLPENVVANCFLNFQKTDADEEEKMSKSRGTAIWIKEYLEQYDPDPLRYYLTAIAPEGQRTAFKFDHFIRRNDEELVATLGNFVHRSLTFIHKYFDGRVPEPGERSDLDNGQLEQMRALPETMGSELEACHFKNALNILMGAMRGSNRYFDTRQPWAQRKEDMAACATTMNVCVNTIRTAAVLMEPFLPFAAARLQQTLGLSGEDMKWDRATDELPPGKPIEKPQILFKKLATEDR